MAEEFHEEDHSEGYAHHVTPPRYYFFNLLALAGLMALTIWASKIDMGATWLNNIFAMTIALIKMVLIISIFMGVFWGTRLIKLWAATGFVWFTLMAIIFGDYFTRDWESVPGWNPAHTEAAVAGSTSPPHAPGAPVERTTAEPTAH